MFIKKSSELDLSEGMESHLVANAKEDRYKFNKIAKAIDLVAQAAESFDRAGRVAAAEALSVFLEKLASSSPESEVKNLLETGTMFPRSDFKESKPFSVGHGGSDSHSAETKAPPTPATAESTDKPAEESTTELADKADAKFVPGKKGVNPFAKKDDDSSDAKDGKSDIEIDEKGLKDLESMFEDEA